VIISTSGRGGLMTAILGSAIISIYAVFSGKECKTSGIWIKLGFVILIVVGGFWYLATSSSNINYYQHGTAFFQNPLNDPTVQYRFRMWSTGWSLFLENPILGIGLRGIPTPWGPDTSEILNYFFYILLSYGLIGFIGLILVISKLVTSYLRGIRSKDGLVRMMSIASICGLLGFLFGLQPMDPYSVTLVFAPLFISYAFSRIQDHKLLDDTQSIGYIPKNQDNLRGGKHEGWQ